MGWGDINQLDKQPWTVSLKFLSKWYMNEKNKFLKFNVQINSALGLGEGHRLIKNTLIICQGRQNSSDRNKFLRFRKYVINKLVKT